MYDAIVIGVGGMGSAALFHLARSGLKVLGIEQFDIPHSYGSSHGSTRIFRSAYSEGAEYVPLLRSAYASWRELEAIAGKSILRLTGGLDIGAAKSWTVEGSRKSCLAHGLEFEELDGGEVNRRFPGYRLPTSARAVYQAQSGYLLSESAIAAYAQAARDRGAEIRVGERVRSWRRDAGGLCVETDAGAYRAARLAITAGSWTGKLCPPLQSLCRPERQVMLWTAPAAPALFAPERFPIFNLEAPGGRFYGFPDHRGEGFKIGKYHHLRQYVDDPDRVDRECGAADEAVLREAVQEYFPGANGPARRLQACLFTNSPDEHFILDRYPGEADVFVAAGFSGHGFKFCSVIGKIVAEFCLDKPSSWDIRRFRLSRLSDAFAAAPPQVGR